MSFDDICRRADESYEDWLKRTEEFWHRPKGARMHEKRFCLDCGNTEPMNVHGRCSCCNSEAVVLAQSIGPYQRMQEESLAECERIFALKGER